VEINEVFELATDAWNRQDQDSYLTFHSEDYEIVTPNMTGTGHDAVRQFWASNFGPFPDNRLTVRRTVVDGETIVEEGVFAGMNTGPPSAPDGTELPATGAAVSVPYAGLHTVRDGRFVSSSFYWDSMALLQQLGLLQQ